MNIPINCARSLSENSVVGTRASVFLSGKDGENSGFPGATRTAERCELTQEAGDIGCIADTAGRSPDEKQAARSQIEFSDTLLQVGVDHAELLLKRRNSRFQAAVFLGQTGLQTFQSGGFV
jgi:hypothetical protein